MPRRAVLAAVALLSGACAVGPDYQRPSAPIPSNYKELAAAAASGPDDWKPAEPRDEVERGAWWEIFGDPVLDGLEAEIDVSNQNLALAAAQFRGARAAVRGARADFFPTLATAPAVARSSPSTGRAGTPAGTSRTTSTDYVLPLDLTWEADVWGKVRRNVEGSLAAAQASAADLEAVRLSLHAELALDYFLLRGVDAERRLLETNVTAYQKALQLTRNRYAQGVVSGVDVAQAETQLETTRAQSTDLSITRAQLEHAIAILVGKPPADFTLPPDTSEVSPPAIPVGIPSELLERRPDVAAAERRMAAANAQVGVATAAFFPRLLLSATAGWESGEIAKWISAPSFFWSVGAALAETLFDAGKRRSVREQAVAGWDASVAAYRAGVLGALAEVEDNLAALRILSREAREQAVAVDAAERALRLARNRYEGGITTYLEVVTAQFAALTDQRFAVDIRTRQMTASVNLIKALGGLWRPSGPTGPEAPSSSIP